MRYIPIGIATKQSIAGETKGAADRSTEEKEDSVSRLILHLCDMIVVLLVQVVVLPQRTITNELSSFSYSAAGLFNTCTSFANTFVVVPARTSYKWCSSIILYCSRCKYFLGIDEINNRL